MEKSKTFRGTKFPPEIIQTSYDKFISKCGFVFSKPKPFTIELTIDEETKSYSSLKDLLILYPRASHCDITVYVKSFNFLIYYSYSETRVIVELKNSADVEEVFQIFEKAVKSFPLKDEQTVESEKKSEVSKQKTYYQTKFPASTIQEGHEKLLSYAKLTGKIQSPNTLQITYENEEWDYPTFDEFFAEYPKAKHYRISHYMSSNYSFTISANSNSVSVLIRAPSASEIQSVFQIFERDLGDSVIKLETKPIRIFIGHGQSTQWKELKDHLHEQHSFDVIAYELGTQAGYTIQEVLKDMLDESSLALLVLTGDDLDSEGRYHARENVIHELGLFQGRLGFKRAIVLKEEGVTEFSNIQGLNQIRFSKNNIRETYGDVLAVIRNEFAKD